MYIKNKNLPYRKSVGIILINKEKKIFLGKRKKSSQLPWQMPQGGIDKNEEPITAVFRELQEEVGTNNAVIIKALSKWVKYDFPERLERKKHFKKKYRGQEQKWFLLQFLGDDNEIDIKKYNPEFKSWKWANIYDLTKDLIDFKKDVYYTIIKELISGIKTI
jgi:putative (di)nucleoside polyphosphate hydrolase